MKILVDTNVIVDNLASREPHDKYSNAIFDLIARNRITGCLNTSSVTDIYFILRKTFSDAESREKVRTLLNLFRAIEVAKADCFTAIDSPISDFEDALAACNLV